MTKRDTPATRDVQTVETFEEIKDPRTLQQMLSIHVCVVWILCSANAGL